MVDADVIGEELGNQPAKIVYYPFGCLPFVMHAPSTRKLVRFQYCNTRISLLDMKRVRHEIIIVLMTSFVTIWPLTSASSGMKF
jgi:hypothetical protein